MSDWKDRLIVLSLEGALCAPDGTVPEVDREVLRLFCMQGGRYTLMTERAAGSVDGILSQLPPVSAPILCSGGAVLYTPGKPITLGDVSVLSSNDAGTVLWTLSRAFPQLGSAVQCANGAFYILHPTEATQRWQKSRGFGGILAQPDALPDAWACAMLLGQPSLIREVEDYLAQNVLVGQFRPARHGHEQLWLTAKLPEQQRLWQHFCDRAHTTPGDIIAVGGTAWDAEWMPKAGLCVAAGGAAVEVRMCSERQLLCTAAEGAAAEYLYALMQGR